VDLALAPGGERVWVSHGQSGDVRLLDARTLAVLAVVPVGPRAWWTALSPDGGRLYVTVGRANELVVVDTAAATVLARIPAGTLPWGVAITEVSP
jgi:YVTN family beta-propeller protein